MTLQSKSILSIIEISGIYPWSLFFTNYIIIGSFITHFINLIFSSLMNHKSVESSPSPNSENYPLFIQIPTTSKVDTNGDVIANRMTTFSQCNGYTPQTVVNRGGGEGTAINCNSQELLSDFRPTTFISNPFEVQISIGPDHIEPQDDCKHKVRFSPQILSFMYLRCASKLYGPLFNMYFPR